MPCQFYYTERESGITMDTRVDTRILVGRRRDGKEAFVKNKWSFIRT